MIDLPHLIIHLQQLFKADVIGFQNRTNLVSNLTETLMAKEQSYRSEANCLTYRECKWVSDIQFCKSKFNIQVSNIDRSFGENFF